MSKMDCDFEAVDEADSKKWLSGILESFGSSSSTFTHKDDFEYNMTHKKRGLAVIFNHLTFQPGLDLNARTGTEVDAFNLKHCLSLHSFDVKIHNDLKAGEVSEEIYRLSKAEDHTKNDCLMIIVLSHGDFDKIYAIDRAYKPDDLWDPFTADNCPSLAGKPKIFLIQACKGDKLDSGTALIEKKGRTFVADGGIETKSTYYRIPNRADFLIAFSTFPGYFSWRNTGCGSWFIQAFVEMMVRYANEKDLLTIMTLVARRVAIGFESCVRPGHPMDMKKQVPYITSTLIRDIYLRKKEK